MNDENVSLSEGDMSSINPQGGYGLEKYFCEQLLMSAFWEGCLDIRVARLHNIYGPRAQFSEKHGKAPSSICRKVVDAVTRGEGSIELWGDGNQVRSFLYIDDCIDGLIKLMRSGYRYPINIGSENPIKIVELARKIIEISGCNININFNENRPIGVYYRNCNSRLAREVMGWSENTNLTDGLGNTYKFIYNKLRNFD